MIMNARTKRIFARLKKRDLPETDSVLISNDRRPSLPHLEEDTIDTSIVPLPQIEHNESAEGSHNGKGRKSLTGYDDFDSDDSVADRNYCPSSSSTDSEYEYRDRDRAKRFLFHEDLITPQDLLEADKSLVQCSSKSTVVIESIRNEQADYDRIDPFIELINQVGPSHDVGHGDHVQTPLTTTRTTAELSTKTTQHLFETDKSLVEYSNTPTVAIETTGDSLADYNRVDPFIELTNQEGSSHGVADGDPFQSPLTTTQATTESSTKKKPKKRIKNVENWQKNISKKARLIGESYTSKVAKKKKDVEARFLKPPCHCRAKCFEKLSDAVRENIFKSFWAESVGWEQRRQYIADRVTKTIKLRTRVASTFEDDKRKYNFNYNFLVNENLLKVCKVMFLNTLCIGEKYVKITLKKKDDNGLTESDQRGKHTPWNKTSETIVTSIKDHIRSYPSYESHYTREKSQKRYLGPELNIALMYKHYKEKMIEEGKNQEQYAKEWLYREVFNTKFNLSFKLPGIDTCDDCDKFSRLIKEETNLEKQIEITKERDDHLQNAQARYNLKAEDKRCAYADKSKRVLFLDLQKCLPTPSLTNTQSFYLRKLWTLNLVIYDASTKTTDNFVWPENIAGRGGNEIASCILEWCQKHLTPTIEELTIWTDNCAGQNRNNMVIACYHMIFALFPDIKRINHKFLLKGHTHMEVDHVHSIIERKKKRLSTMEILIPHDWAQFIRTCASCNPFHVNEMSCSNFKDFTHLFKKSGALIQRKKDTKGNDFKISSTVWWQLRREAPGLLFFKTEFSDYDFCQVNMNRNLKKNFAVSPLIPNVRETEKPISTAKYRDLQTLMNWVPTQFHTFYKNIPHLDDVSDAPEAQIED